MRRVRMGEDARLELKSVRVSGGRVRAPDRSAMADELAAFANSQGGTVIIGVDDKTRRIQGIPLNYLDAVESWVREICNDSVQPSLDADIRKEECEDSEDRVVPVLCVQVERSLFVHKSPGGYFRRIGNSKREMPPEVLARLFQERSQSRVIRFDESIVPATTLADLHYSLTQRFVRGDVIEERDESSATSEETLRKLRIVADAADGRVRLTLAGVLLCTTEPQRWLPHAYIQAVSYAGERTDADYQTEGSRPQATLSSVPRIDLLGPAPVLAYQLLRPCREVNAIDSPSEQVQLLTILG